MLKTFAGGGGRRVDTARIYAGGATEPIVAEALAGASAANRTGCSGSCRGARARE